MVSQRVQFICLLAGVATLAACGERTNGSSPLTQDGLAVATTPIVATSPSLPTNSDTTAPTKPPATIVDIVALEGQRKLVRLTLPDGYEPLEPPEQRTIPGHSQTLTNQTYTKFGVGTLTVSILEIDEAGVADAFAGLRITKVEVDGRTYYQHTASEEDASHMAAVWDNGALVSVAGSGTRPELLIDALVSAIVENVQ